MSFLRDGSMPSESPSVSELKSSRHWQSSTSEFSLSSVRVEPVSTRSVHGVNHQTSKPHHRPFSSRHLLVVWLFIGIIAFSCMLISILSLRNSFKKFKLPSSVTPHSEKSDPRSFGVSTSTSLDSAAIQKPISSHRSAFSKRPNQPVLTMRRLYHAIANNSLLHVSSTSKSPASISFSSHSHSSSSSSSSILSVSSVSLASSTTSSVATLNPIASNTQTSHVSSSQSEFSTVGVKPSPFVPLSLPPYDPMSPLVVDAVFTYCNHQDDSWLSGLISFTQSAGVNRSLIDNRYRDWGELRYSMRSVLMHAPYVRKIHVVVASQTQVPKWLNPLHPRVQVVYHHQILPAHVLPTFNSLVIESALHRIPGLADDYLYFNNDIFLNRETVMEEVFGDKREYRQYLDWELPIFTMNAPTFCPEYVDGSRFDLPPMDVVIKCTPHIEFFWIRALSIHLFSVKVSNWFAHIPHFHNRHIMSHLETKLAPFLDAARSNRVRNPLTDVSMHILYESLVNALSPDPRFQLPHLDGSKSTPFLIPPELMHLRRMVKQQPMNECNIQYHKRDQSAFYSYLMFSSGDGPKKDASPSFFFWSTLLSIKAKTHLMGIEDDMGATSQFSSHQLALHRCRLNVMMHLGWPARAPWEVAVEPETIDRQTNQPITEDRIKSIYVESYLHDLMRSNCQAGQS